MSSFAEQLGLSKTDNLSNVKLILGSRVIGRFPPGFEIKVQLCHAISLLPLTLIKKIMQSATGPEAVHVLVAQKVMASTSY